MIAGYDKGRTARCTQAIQIGGGLPELLHLGPLGQITADDHEVGLVRIYPGKRCFHNEWIVRAKMNVGKMCDAAHRR